MAQNKPWKQLCVMTPSDATTIARREKVRDMLMACETNLNKISKSTGVSYETTLQDVDAVFRDLQALNKTDPTDAYLEAISRFSLAAQCALDSYEASKEVEETITTTSNPQRCGYCKGSGFTADTLEWCSNCGGEGKIQITTTTKKIRGQTGDSSMLSEFRKNVEQIAKLKGCYIAVDKDKPQIQNTGNTTIIVGDSNVNKFDVSKMTPEMILEARGLIAKMKPLMIQHGDDEDNGEESIIDVEVDK